jgi:hypothetical protein
MAEAGHSSYSASGFEAAMLCPGKPVMEEGKPNRSSIYAATGTVAHMLLEFALRDGTEPPAYLGRIFQVEGFDIEVDEDMVDAVETALGNIREMAGGAAIMPEQQVNYSRYLQVDRDEAWGTADAIVPRGDELQVHDYKNGSGVVVEADENPQMMLYGLGALEAVNDLLGPFKTVRLVIHQPNVKSAPSEWACTVEELEHWALTKAGDAVDMRRRAANLEEGETIQDYLAPGEKQCKFCRAKATCPALRAEVAKAVFTDATVATPEEFAAAQVHGKEELTSDGSDWLAASMKKADLIEDWVKAVRAEVEHRLLDGQEVPGYKVVEGKLGHRKWTDPAAVEAELKTMRLKEAEMYDFKLISPTTAEKLAKAKVIGPRQWPKLKTMYSQTKGKPHVAPATDSRPALVLTPAVDDFSDVSSVSYFA